MSLGQEAERVESATDGRLTITTIAMPPNNSSIPPISCTTPMRSVNMPYDRKFPVGKLDKALDEAASISWTVVSMKDDWTAIFPLHAILTECGPEPMFSGCSQIIWFHSHVIRF